MQDYWEERLATAKNYIKKLDIIPKNRDYLLKFVNHLSAEGLTKVRQVKYVYTLGTLSRKIKKDFAKITKNDAEKIISDINNSKLKEWTKRDFKIVFKRLIKWIREEEGQEFEKKQYPKEVSWISTTMKQERKRKYEKELLTIDDVTAMANNTENLRDKCFILLLYESGARISELMGIKIKDIINDQYGSRIRICGKTGERVIRIVAAAPSISTWLTQHPNRMDKNSLLFCAIGNSKRGEVLDSHTFRKMLRVTAKKAGINKPVNPHHFRHSRATELASKLTEATLCDYMGWIIGSREAATYVHLAGRDNDDVILSMHGLIKEETNKDKFQLIVCPRCGIKNDPGAKFCQGCSLGLDLPTVINFEKTKDDLTSSIVSLIGDRDQALKTLEALTKLLQGNK